MTIAMRIGALVAAASLALALVGIIALDTADAGGFNEQVSGNFIDTAIDTNDDGMNANAWSGAANGNGSPSYEGLVEVALDFGTPCEGGGTAGSVVEYSIVRRYANGDLMFSRLVNGDLCFNPGTGLASLTINAEVTGGTGQYAGATGTYTADYTIQGLIQVPGQGIAHGAFYGSTSG